MNELDRLRAQNKILRELIEAFIATTDPSLEHSEASTRKVLHVRMKASALLSRIDTFTSKRLSHAIG